MRNYYLFIFFCYFDTLVAQQAANALSQLEQSPQPRTAKEVQAAKKRDADLKPLADALTRGLLQHADKDVRLLVAICVTELFRVKAPEPPFEDKHLRVLVTPGCCVRKHLSA